MRFVVLCLFLCVSLYSCDDGDIITVDLDFGETFEACGDLVFYKTKTDPNESLSLQITSTNPSLALSDFTAVTLENNIATLVNTEIEHSINGTSNTFNFRTYNTEPVDFFCEDVPPSTIQITSDQESTTGNALFSIMLIEDDLDGILAENEDLNNNGDLTDDDTDMDGIPNYLDADDDGDNVLTINEIDTENADGDNNPLTNPLNTDGEDLPDYLDTDDDNDGVLTRDEENDMQDQDPTNDRTDIDNPNLPDYLNSVIASTVSAIAYRSHEIDQVFTVSLIIENIQIDTLTDTEIAFGILQDAITNNSREITPDFPE